jgi:hypothetical protein
MARNPRVKVQTSPHSLVFRRIDKIIRNDHAIKQAFTTILSWTGSEDDTIAPAVDNCPYLKMSPGETGDKWYGPSSFEAFLTIDFEMGVAGSNAEDALDLYHAIRRAIYPTDHTQSLANQNAIKEAGASMTGQPVFGPPGFSIHVMGSTVLTLCNFTLQVDVLLNINP